MPDTIVTTRPVNEEDRAFLYRVFVSSREEEFALLDWPPHKIDDLMRQQFDLQTKGYGTMFPDAEHLVILSDGEPAGRVLIHRGDREIRMVDIAILTPFRRHGIGRAIVERLKDESRRSGKPLRHHVYRGELNAIRFYFALGYRIAVNEDAGYQMEWAPSQAAGV